MKLLKLFFLVLLIVIAFTGQEILGAQKAELRVELKKRLKKLMTPEEFENFEPSIAAASDDILPLFEKLVTDSEKAQKNLNNDLESWEEKVHNILFFGPVLSGILYLVYKCDLYHVVSAKLLNQVDAIVNVANCMLSLIVDRSCVELSMMPFFHILCCGIVYVIGIAALCKNIMVYINLSQLFIGLIQDFFNCFFQPIREFIGVMVSSVIRSVAAAKAMGRTLKAVYDYGLYGFGYFLQGSRFARCPMWLVTRRCIDLRSSCQAYSMRGRQFNHRPLLDFYQSNYLQFL